MFYFSTSAHAEVAGRVGIDCECERCGGRFAYPLVRFGSGTQSAPYGIGHGAASRGAAASAERDLHSLLSEDAELVPCPHCGWVNESAIASHRRLRLRVLWNVAVWGGGFGLLIAGLVVWFTLQSPIAKERNTWPVLLCWCVGLSIAWTASLLGLRWLLLKRVRPNADFPETSRVPAGTPPAYVLRDDAPSGGETASDGTAEAWMPAVDAIPRISPGGLHMRVGIDDVPPVCCVCLSGDELTDGVLYKSDALKALFPMCSSCGRRANRRGRLAWWVIAVGGTLAMYVASGVCLRETADRVIATIAGGLVMLFAAEFGKTVASQPVRPVGGVSDRGVLRLRVASAGYAKLLRSLWSQPAAPEL